LAYPGRRSDRLIIPGMSTARGILTKRLPRPGRGLFSLKAPVRIDPPAEERGFKPPVPPATESASPSEGAMPREPIRVSRFL
jgi:hypothetical protein